MNQFTLVSVAIIVAGCLLIAYDERYGPKDDDVMYLWIFPVMLLMTVAACLLLYQLATP